MEATRNNKQLSWHLGGIVPCPGKLSGMDTCMSGENSMGEMSRGLFGGNPSGDFRGDVRGIL